MLIISSLMASTHSWCRSPLRACLSDMRKLLKRCGNDTVLPLLVAVEAGEVGVEVIVLLVGRCFFGPFLRLLFSSCEILSATARLFAEITEFTLLFGVIYLLLSK
jgi:hypothetical protein